MVYDFTNNFDSARKEISYAYKNVPFFAKHMQESNQLPTDIKSPQTFIKIPPTEKKHYRKNFPIEVLSKNYSFKDERLVRFPSSGTAGERLLTLELGHVYMKRAMNAMSVYPFIYSTFNTQPLHQIRYAPPNCSDVECSNPYSSIQDRLLRDGTLVLSVYHDLLTTPEQILQQNVQEIEKHQPQIYFVDPTHFAFLLRYLKKHEFSLPKAPVITSYTSCIKGCRRQIVEGFNREVPISEVVAMSELGYLAMECPVGALHMNAKSFYLEFIRNGRHAEPGEMAELYVTTIDNGCIPHIRYRTADVYRLIDSPCICGHKYPMIKLEGRLRNFIFRNGTILLTPLELDQIVGDPIWMDMYKLKQIDEQGYIFSYIPNEKYEMGMERPIYKELFSRLGHDVNLTIERVNYIPSERSGKFLSCVSEVGEKMVEKGFCL